FGAGVAGGVPDYGLNYGALSTSNDQQLGYAAPNPDPYGLAAIGAGTEGTMYSSSLTPSTDLQSRQSMISSLNGATGQGLNSYDSNGLSSYRNGLSSYGNGLSSYGNGLSSYSNGLSSYSNGLSSYGNGGMDSNSASSLGYDPQLTNDLTNGLSSSLSNGMTAGLGNALSNGMTAGLSNALSNGVNSFTGSDANQISSLNGLNSLVSSVNQAAANDMSSGGKYAAESLSAGLDSPNGIANIANLLNSASTSFDTDSQSHLMSNNADMNKFGQRFGSQRFGNQRFGSQRYGSQGSQSSSQQVMAPYQQGLGAPSLAQQSSKGAEVQAFENQLNHLSTEKLKELGGNIHASYGSFGDSIDSNNLNDIGQIASTGISDSSLQRLLGQLMAGQFGHAANHMSSSQSTAGLGGLPSDSGSYDTGNEEGLGSQQSMSLDDQQEGFPNPLVEPIHGQTIHAHASDKPKYHDSLKQAHSSASQTAFSVQIHANREHQRRLKNLKEKLRMLREKLHKLKLQYDDGDDDDGDNENDITSDLTEKSELDTLDDLKNETEEAIKELRTEMAKVIRRKGGKKVIFIHKFPQSGSSSDVNGRKKGETIGQLETEMLELIDDDDQIIHHKFAKKKIHKAKHHEEGPTLTLTELEKQAEQEVNYLTKKNPKVVKKKQHAKNHKTRQTSLNPGLHIHIPGLSVRTSRHRHKFTSTKHVQLTQDKNDRFKGRVEKHIPADDHIYSTVGTAAMNKTTRTRHSSASSVNPRSRRGNILRAIDDVRNIFYKGKDD
ncbi:hypothetical protein QZH41_017296, partial [Actinostola sp. cb2023]